MMHQPKWIMEVQDDDEESMVRILRLGGKAAELKYLAMTEPDAENLITALDWMDSFKAGMVGIPQSAKKAVRPRPRTEIVLQIEEPKPVRRKPKSKS